LYRSARICSQILAAKCLQASERSPLSKHFKRKMRKPGGFFLLDKRRINFYQDFLPGGRLK
jgi:hypothetical protein